MWEPGLPERRTDIRLRQLIDTAIALQRSFGPVYIRFFLMSLNAPDHMITRVLAGTVRSSFPQPLYVKRRELLIRNQQ